MKQVMMKKTSARDIVPIFSGYEACESEHKFGPAAREHHLIHFCLKGKGVLSDKYGTHKIEAGDLFIIRPGEITVYIADKTDPWEYAWLAFGGDMAEIFSTDRSVYPAPARMGDAVRELAESDVDAPSAYISVVFELIYRLFREKKSEGDLAQKIKRYIDFNYMNDLSVKALAEAFGFERSHLYRVFKESVGTSPKEYLTKTRLEQAKILLSKGYSVSEAAFAVGYRDPFGFSGAFKAHFGVPPKVFKRKG